MAPLVPLCDDIVPIIEVGSHRADTLRLVPSLLDGLQLGCASQLGLASLCLALRPLEDLGIIRGMLKGTVWVRVRVVRRARVRARLILVLGLGVHPQWEETGCRA